MRYISNSPRATERLGAGTIREIKKVPRSRALVIALDGPLGGGKTTFTRGVFRALGVRKRAVSPTFVVMRRMRLLRGRSLYHIDLYRIADPQTVKMLEVQRIFADPGNVVVIEWAEHAARFLPRDAVRVLFRHGRTPTERVIIVKNENKRK